MEKAAGERKVKGQRAAVERDLGHKTQEDRTSSLAAVPTTELLPTRHATPSSPLQSGVGKAGALTPSAHVQPPASSRGHGAALWPCSEGDREAAGLATGAEPTQSHAISYTAL